MNPQADGLSVDTVSVRFGAVTVLHHLTCRFPTDRICALVGANGAGKSTLLDCLSGFVPASTGQISWAGQATSAKRRAKLAARLHQRTVLPELLTCGDLLYLAAAPRAATWLLSRWRRDAKLNPIGLLLAVGRVPLDATISELSGGQQRLVALAAVLLTCKPVLLLDEPFAGISSAIEGEVRSVIRAHAKGRVVVIAEHALDVVERLADDVIVLQSGRVSDVVSGHSIDRARLVPQFGG